MKMKNKNSIKQIALCRDFKSKETWVLRIYGGLWREEIHFRNGREKNIHLNKGYILMFFFC